MSNKLTDNLPHPSQMSDEDKQALYADLEREEALGDPDPTDPTESEDPADAELAALDDFDGAPGATGAAGADEGTGQDGGAAAGATGPDAAAATEAPGATGATGATGAAEPPPAGDPRVPKARLDEVIAQRDAAREETAAARAELERVRAEQAAAAAKAGAPRDFDAEAAAIEAKYDAGDIDLHEYNRAQRALAADQSAAAAAAAVASERTRTLEEKVATGWDAEYNAFAAAHADFVGTPKNLEVLQQAITAVEAKYKMLGDPLDDSTLMEEASAIAFRKVGYTPPAPPADPGTPQRGGQPTTPRQQRQAAALAAAGRAANGTPPANVGRGERSTSGKPDLAAVKPGEFSKNYSRTEQEQLLGGPNAL
jgi:hypothetical protein